MSFDDDAEGDAPGFRRPPHPDDRLWRHPSEMGDHALAPLGASREADADPPEEDDGGLWRIAAAVALGVIVVVAGLAAVVVGGLGAGGGSGGSTEASTTGRAGVGGRGDDAAPVAAVEEVAPSLVGLPGGSGVIVSSEGLVLTSAALVEGDGPVRVRLPNGVTVDAQVVGTDPMTGLGVLDLPGDDHTPAPLADVAAADDNGRGVAVYTVAVTDGSVQPEATAGAIGTTRKLDGAGGHDLEGVLEVEGDATGPSALGGPVVDAEGAVFGITTALGAQRTSYLTPIDVGQRVAGDLVETGRVRHSWLGVEGADHVEGSGLHDRAGQGAELVAVEPGGPAAAAGLRPGDVVVAIDGRPVDRMSDLVRWLRARPPGHPAELAVERGGETLAVTAVLGERPD
ncbi:MAG TPA: trypsin-like peptidase domain-containing protein [Acidimicrobiales bacterium]